MKPIYLTRGKFTKVDDEDYEVLTKWSWYAAVTDRDGLRFCAVRSEYSKATGKQSRVYMHRQIMKPSNSRVEVDHIDGNSLNNQRSNLRLVSHKENVASRKIPWMTKKKEDNNAPN